jgi:glutaredoxin-related protein
MERKIFDPARVHPAAKQVVSEWNREIVDECARAIANHDVVVIGMAQNPHPRRARNALKKHGVPFEYLEYGSYLSLWKRRLALKMWTGWPTFPMVFVKGSLIGGADELEALLASGELQAQLTSAERHASLAEVSP